MSANWKSLAIAEAQNQGVDVDIVLATVEAETGGNNILGDNGNALGFGQVWPKWHNDAFIYACNKYRAEWPNSLSDQQQLVLSNDGLSMAATVYVIGRDWASAGKNFRNFTLSYVGPAIPDNDYNRRYNIWLKYQSGNYPSSGVGLPQYRDVGYNPSDSNSPYGNITIPSSNYGIVANSQRFGNILYGRRYRVLVSDANGVALDVSQLRCTFKIQKSILQPLNISEIIVYNLNADTENSIIQEGNRVVIEAGYEGEQYGLIFDGDLIQPIRDKEDSVTYRLFLYSLDGDRPMNFGFVSYSMVKGQTSRSQIENIASKASIPSQLGNISDGLSDTKLSRGKVVFGMMKDYLRQIAHSEDAAFYVEDGKVNIIKAKDLPDDEIFDLTPSSGLIGVPAQNELGVSFKCMLNPRIKLHSLVHIDNSLVRARQYQPSPQSIPPRSLDNDGIYQVIGIRHVGDTRGDEWYTECETVSQSGYMPSMMNTPSANPYR